MRDGSAQNRIGAPADNGGAMQQSQCFPAEVADSAGGGSHARRRRIDATRPPPENRAMNPSATWVISEAYAGLQAQALGLTEAAGLAAETRILAPRGVWRHVPARWWPSPAAAIGPDTLRPPLPELVVGCGGKAAAVVASLRHRVRGVIVQHPRMNPQGSPAS